MEWSGDVPIYKQLESRLVSWIMTGVYAEGESLPSVRKLSVELNINHLTVARAVDALELMQIVEKRRGLGVFVQVGAKQRLIEMEKQKFIELELPGVARRARELGVTAEQLAELVIELVKKEAS